MIKKLVCYCLLGLLVQNCHAEADEEDNLLNEAGAASADVFVQNEQWLEQQERFQSLLADVEKRYGETAALLRSLPRKISQKYQSLAEIRSKIQSCQQQIDKESKELAIQIRSAYVMGQDEKLKLMLNQQDPALSSRMMIYYNLLNKARLAKLAKVQANVSRLDQLDQQRQTETVLLKKYLEQKQAEKTALNDFRQQRDELLKQATIDSYPSEQQFNQLQLSENKLKNLLASLSGETNARQQQPLALLPVEKPALPQDDFPTVNGAFPTLKGKLPWPVKGELASVSDSQSASVKDGILINAKEGADIHAVTQGKVVYAEWLGGYGLLIIIEHDDRYMTLYGFNQSLYKQVGESVQAGEVIASVGQSDGRSQPGLYFGIRKQAEPNNPLEWLKK
jgi:septal ring factor EnvC (AmiA/AmiB activator)